MFFKIGVPEAHWEKTSLPVTYIVELASLDTGTVNNNRTKLEVKL
jgi:hypothetical protein